MDRFFGGLLRHRKLIIALFLGMAIAGALLIPLTEVNYDLAKYLPEGSGTKAGIAALEDSFGYPAMANVMVEDVTLTEAAQAKARIAAIDGVQAVVWLDDYADLAQPEAFLDSALLDSYYRDGAALFIVQFDQDDYSLRTGTALEGIREAFGERVSVSGSAEDTRNMRSTLNGEMAKIMLIVVPICLAILVLASQSWIEPLLYLATLGVAVLINMGTNALFGEVSFITFTTASVLQLAISMDYSLFLSHRFQEELRNGLTPQAALVAAAKASLPTVAASALTTLAGFVALVFMQYRIGLDMGLVLAKGILLSLVVVMLFMPPLLLVSHKQIVRTAHRPLLPRFDRVAKGMVKLRYVVLPLVAVVAAVSFLAQQHVSFLYGDSSGSSSAGAAALERQAIEERFGIYNPVMLLVPGEDPAREAALARDLEALPGVRGVQALATMADPAIPRELIPAAAREQFVRNGMSRMIVELGVSGETPEVFATVTALKAAVAEQYPEGGWFAAGTSTSLADIKATVDRDVTTVNLVSILAVALIIALTFRSLSLPVLLVGVIEASIWINMGVPYFTGQPLIFIGYLVISSLQLGATIDYAILLTSRYVEFRGALRPRDAAAQALATSGLSVLTSGLILAAAGFTLYAISQVPSIQEIGLLLGRGTALSVLLVLLALPGLLVLLDRVVLHTTLGLRRRAVPARAVRKANAAEETQSQSER